MKRSFTMGILVPAIVALSFSVATSEDQDVLEALERIKAAVEDGVPQEELQPLLEKAKIQIDRLQRGDVRKDCFRAAARRSHYWYDLGLRSWQALTKNQEQRDKYARQAEYGGHHMKEINLKMVENYDKLIRHAHEALPSKWEYGSAELDRAQQCLNP